MVDGVSRCGRKCSLAVFFTVSLLAFIFCLLALISPSWQLANLENGRTEHHHGLWLDCKRDYSPDYGRPREYYETLYRRDMQGSPFDVFFLPALQCVYKFDYYIDPEDLYDHNHDENRIQNDANQHLFLGWKIAALVGVGVGVLFSATTLLLGICSFCHRTFICACTVLITIAAILSTLGVSIFYAWANYQDNKVLKEEEEDEVYEQTLGWAFYFQVVGVALNWLGAMMGCCVTSISFSKQRAKLVKIEVVEGDDSQLLSSSASQPFKRSFSAIYRVDSAALRQWEQDYLRHVREQQNTGGATRGGPSVSAQNNFKRTASMPNFSKKQQKKQRKSMRASVDFFSSTSNITEMTNAGSNVTLNTQETRETTQTAPATVMLPVAVPIPQPPAPTTPRVPLKSALKTPIQQRREAANVNDVTYEYMPCDSTIGVSTFLGARTPSRDPHQYDEVYEQIAETYLEPNSVKARHSSSTISTDIDQTARLLPTSNLASSSQSIPMRTHQQRTTVIDDIVRPSSFVEDDQQRHRVRERMIMEEISRSERFKKRPPPPPKPAAPPSTTTTSKPTSLSIRDFGIDISKPSNGSCQIGPSTSTEFGLSEPSMSKSEDRLEMLRGRPITPAAPPATPPRPLLLPPTATPSTSFGCRHAEPTDDLPSPPEIAINTFAAKQKSITNISFRGTPSAAALIFERPESTELNLSSSKASSVRDETAAANRRPFTSLSQHSLHRRLLNAAPEEVDRSVGSSTVLENDTRDSPNSYAREAALRLKMFVQDRAPVQDETTV